MNCVISGEFNFISLSLCNRLVELGNQIVLIDSNQDLSDVEFQQKILRVNLNKTDEFFYNEKPDMFFHFLKDDAEGCNIKNFIDSNIQILIEALDKAKDYESKFILIGSKPLSGKPDRTISRLSQYFAEELAQMFCENNSLALAVVRHFEVFGNSCNNENALIYRLEKAKTNNSIFSYKGSENERKNFIHLDDLISAIISISKNRWRGQIFNLGMQKTYSIKELVELFEIEKFVTNPINKKEYWDPVPDTTFAERSLQWKVKTYVEDYAEKFLQKKFRENPRHFFDSIWDWFFWNKILDYDAS